MISLSTAASLVGQKTKKLISAIVIHEMRKSAAGYGLHNDNLFPDKNPQPTIDLQLKKRKPKLRRH